MTFKQWDVEVQEGWFCYRWTKSDELFPCMYSIYAKLT